MTALLAPATGLMNRLTYRRKMILISLLLLTPLVVVTWLLMAQLAGGSRQAQAERQGLEYISALRQVYQHLAQHRGMTNAFLNGGDGFRDRILEVRKAIARDLARIDAVDARYGDAFRARAEWAAIREQWRKLEGRAFDGPAGEVFAAHSQLIARIYDLFGTVANHSGLLLDPALNTTFLADALVYRLPRVTENLGQARGLSSGVAARGEISLQQRVRLSTMLANVAANKKDVADGMRISFKLNPGLEERLGGLLREAQARVGDFGRQLEREVLAATQIRADPGALFAAGTRAIQANYRLYDALVPELDALLQQRGTELDRQRGLILLLILLGVGLALYLFAGFYSSVLNAVTLIDDSVNRVAEGDLTVSVESRTRDEISSIAEALNRMVGKLRAIIEGLEQKSERLAAASEELTSVTGELHRGTLEQQGQTEQIATAMNQMAASVQEVARNAEEASENAEDADRQALGGGRVIGDIISSIDELAGEVGDTATVIHELETHSGEIGSVVEVIREIAEQTNLLALNAAIEAARAGEQGRGFAVVADEVRALANRTQESTEQIQKMVQNLQERTGTAVRTMEKSRDNATRLAGQAGEAGKALESIVSAIGRIRDMTTQVAAASEEQASVTEEINRNVVTVADITTVNVTGADRVADASGELSRLATDLREVVSRFRV